MLSSGIREDDEVEKVGTPQSVVREIDVGMGVQASDGRGNSVHQGGEGLLVGQGGDSAGFRRRGSGEATNSATPTGQWGGFRGCRDSAGDEWDSSGVAD